MIPSSLLEGKASAVKGLSLVEYEELVATVHRRPAAIALELKGMPNDGIVLTSCGNEGRDTVEWGNAARTELKATKGGKLFFGHRVRGDA